MTPPSTLIFLRHAQTPWNKAGLTMGQSDISLSDLGRQEANQAVAALKMFPIDVIVCSHLKRCLQTITPFRAVGDCQISINPAWAERSWGVYEGVSKSQRGQETHPENGETDADFRDRIQHALNDLPGGENILLVSHSGVFRELRRFGYESDPALDKIPHAIPVRLRRNRAPQG